MFYLYTSPANQYSLFYLCLLHLPLSNEDDAVEVIPSGGGVKTNSVYYVTGAGLTAVDGTYNYVEAGIWECSNCALACTIEGDPTSHWGITIGCIDPTGNTLGYAGSHGIYGSGSGFNAGPNGGGCLDNSDPSSCTFGRRTYWPGPIPKISAAVQETIDIGQVNGIVLYLRDLLLYADVSLLLVHSHTN